jgi:hypothetical protein
MPNYKVQGLKLQATAIEAARQTPGFAFIAIRYAEAPANKLTVHEVFAADANESPIGGIPFETTNEKPVQLKQQWIQDSIYLISDAMLHEVSDAGSPPKAIASMEFEAKPQPFTQDGNDYVSFKVKTRHK